ncbi:MAG: hypothetical protein J6I80_01720 [Clostridia bacterium]|nr:hypothetical protein [Clostridia bacterium]
MKKLISVILITAILTLGGITACAEDAFKITVGTLDESLNVNAGDEIVVPVYLSGNVGVYSYALEYSFDPNVLELQDDKMKQNGKSDYKCLINDFTINNKGSSVIMVSLAGGSKDVTDNGVIAYLFFKVKDTALRGFTNVNVTYKNGNVCNYKPTALYPARVNGGVYVHSDNVASTPSQSSVPSASSSKPQSSNTSSRPIGYVPSDTLPETAPDVYNSQMAATSSTEQSSSNISSNIISSSDVSSTQIQQSSSESTSSRWTIDGEIEVLNDMKISAKTLILIILVGIVIIAGAVVSYVLSNKNKK